MAQYTVSYVMTTLDRLPHLRLALGRLVAARQPDEEIVVADRGSTDGTAEYLRELHAAGQIQQLVSGPDQGAAHGMNKSLLLAKGKLLKLVTDGDVFCYPAIREAAAFMATQPEVDVLLGTTGQVQLTDLSYATLHEAAAANFQRWLQRQETVWMVGLPLLIRRRSLSVTGLFNPAVLQVDTDFTYRITSLNINIAWSTALLAMHLEDPSGKSWFCKKTLGGSGAEVEAERLRLYYTHPEKRAASSGDAQGDEIKSPFRPPVGEESGIAEAAQQEGFARYPTSSLSTAATPVAAAFDVCDAFMANFNAGQQTDYYYKTSKVEKTIQK